MADDEKKTDEEQKPRSKKPVLITGGIVAVTAVAYLAAMMAVPGEQPAPTFGGPFVAPLTDDKITVNLRDESNKRFVVLNLNAMFSCYSESYYAARAADPVYVAELKDVLLGLASTKTRAEVLGKDAKPVFMEEIRMLVEPLLFPIQVGMGSAPLDVDPESGIGPGTSIAKSTMRGPFEEHVLHVDVAAGTIALGDGEPIAFMPDDGNLEVVGSSGKVVYLDVTEAMPEFKGEVKIGVLGRLRRVLWSEVLVQ